jgi:hypothetical protein
MMTVLRAYGGKLVTTPTIIVPMLAIWLSACRGIVLKLLDGRV